MAKGRKRFNKGKEHVHPQMHCNRKERESFNTREKKREREIWQKGESACNPKMHCNKKKKEKDLAKGRKIRQKGENMHTSRCTTIERKEIKLQC
jgi:hypothetical protein